MGRKWLYLVGFAVLALVALFFYQKYRVAPQIQFGQLRLTDTNGQPVNLEQWNGKKRVICFSASWCPNCRKELDDLQKVKDDLQQVEILVISDEPLETIEEFRTRHGYTFTFLRLEQRFFEVGVQSIPVSYIMNPAGEVTKQTVGYLDWTDPSTRSHLKMLMN